jgi:hypothetical protein
MLLSQNLGKVEFIGSKVSLPCEEKNSANYFIHLKIKGSDLSMSNSQSLLKAN